MKNRKLSQQAKKIIAGLIHLSIMMGLSSSAQAETLMLACDATAKSGLSGSLEVMDSGTVRFSLRQGVKSFTCLMKIDLFNYGDKAIIPIISMSFSTISCSPALSMDLKNQVFEDLSLDIQWIQTTTPVPHFQWLKFVDSGADSCKLRTFDRVLLKEKYQLWKK